jgi:hypothetical protein
MFGMSDAHHFRKMVAGFCMAVSPLCLLIGFAVDPDASYAFLFAGAVLMAPAALGLMHILREREAALGHMGGGMALAGVVGMAGLIGMDVNATTDLVNRVDHITGVSSAMFIVTLLLGAGYLALGMGMFRAHATASWAAACLMVAGVAFDVALIISSGGLAIASAAALVVGQGMVGLQVWRETDEAWDHTPVMGAR